MPNHQVIASQFRDLEFQVTTSSTPDAILKAAHVAADACRRVGHHEIVEGEPSDGSSNDDEVYFLVKGGFISGGIGACTAALVIRWTAAGANREVALTVEDYSTEQARFFLIPVAPRKAPGYPAVRKFSQTLRATLAE